MGYFKLILPVLTALFMTAETVLAEDGRKSEISKEFVENLANNVSDIMPSFGAVAFSLCNNEFSLDAADVNVLARLNNSIVLPISPEFDREGKPLSDIAKQIANQSITIGSEDLQLDFNVFTNDKIDLAGHTTLKEYYENTSPDDMDISCDKKANTIYRAQLNFNTQGRDFSTIIYRHPFLNVDYELRLKQFSGKAIRKGKNGKHIFASILGVVQGRVYNKNNQNIAFEDMEMFIRIYFHPNPDGNGPKFVVKGMELSEGLKEVFAKEKVSDQTILVKMSGAVEVNTPFLNVRTGPGPSHKIQKVVTQGEQFTLVGSFEDWQEIKLDESSKNTYWVHKKFVDILEN